MSDDEHLMGIKSVNIAQASIFLNDKRMLTQHLQREERCVRPRNCGG